MIKFTNYFKSEIDEDMFNLIFDEMLKNKDEEFKENLKLLASTDARAFKTRVEYIIKESYINEINDVLSAWASKNQLKINSFKTSGEKKDLLTYPDDIFRSNYQNYLKLKANITEINNTSWSLLKANFTALKPLYFSSNEEDDRNKEFNFEYKIHFLELTEQFQETNNINHEMHKQISQIKSNPNLNLLDDSVKSNNSNFLNSIANWFKKCIYVILNSITSFKNKFTKNKDNLTDIYYTLRFIEEENERSLHADLQQLTQIKSEHFNEENDDNIDEVALDIDNYVFLTDEINTEVNQTSKLEDEFVVINADYLEKNIYKNQVQLNLNSFEYNNNFNEWECINSTYVKELLEETNNKSTVNTI